MNEAFELYLKKIKNLELIKKGGQKEVFEGIDENNKKIIIKIGTFETVGSLERIKREIDFLNSIDSKYYPKNYDFLINITEKEFLIIEEFINSIEYSLVKQHYNTEEKLIYLLNELITGLTILWDNNIIHRDLKPDNILFNENFEPRIIDLGIARFLNLSSLTQTFALRGPCTPIYAAPEQLTNQKNIIDMRTDFFALGIIILELLYGFHPFNPDKVGIGASTVENILNGQYVKPTETMGLSKPFCYLISRLLNPIQFKRFRNYVIINDFIKKHW